MKIVKPEDADSIGPYTMYDEFDKALSEPKNVKSEGIDNIPAELLKASGSTERHELFDICKQIYNHGEWPDDFMQSIVISIERKVENV